MIVTARSEMDKWVLWNFLRERKVYLPVSEDFNAIARLNSKGDILGVVAYNGFAGQTCCIHDAGEGNWLSKDFLRAVFDYPFNQLGIVQIFATVAASNEKALNLDRRVGFKDFARIKDGWKDGEDLMVLSMRREDCRWIEQERMAA